MSTRSTLAAFALTGALLASVALGAAGAAEKWGPFRGRLVDVETGQPIAGAAVLVVWWEHVPNPVQGHTKFYDARETVTDAEGRFEVSRLTPPFFAFRIPPPDIMLFAPGYVEQSEIVTPPPPQGQPFVDPTEIRMRRLKTRQELLRDKSRSRPGRVPDDKMPGFLRAINIERAILGLGRIGPAPGERP